MEPKTAEISEWEVVPREDSSASCPIYVQPRCEPTVRDFNLQKSQIYPNHTTDIDQKPLAQVVSTTKSDTSDWDPSRALDITIGYNNGNPVSSFSHPTALLSQLQSLPSPVSIRSLHSYQVPRSSITAKLHIACGPILLQRWNISDREPQYRATKSKDGYGITVMFTSALGKVSFAIYFLRKCRQFSAPSISIQWNLSFPSLVQDDSVVMRLARMGDVRGLRSLFLQGKARPSDVMENGRGLLHVSNGFLLWFLDLTDAHMTKSDCG
jgi:hypothetical protein